jgi:hypothetical protein
MTRLFKTAAVRSDKLDSAGHRSEKPAMIRSALLASLLSLSTLSAQGPDAGGAAARAALDRLSWIEGEWVGPAWYQMGPRRSNAAQKERIYRAAGGTVLVIHGLGTASDPGAPPGLVLHDAFAVVHWDAARQQYVMKTHVANGNSLEVVLEVGEKRIVWGFENQAIGRMRYTISLTPDGTWQEIGERSADQGATWTKFLEMNLKKVGPVS